jgi:hypothetical protein
LKFVVEHRESFAIAGGTDGDGGLGIGGTNDDVIVAAGDGRLGGPYSRSAPSRAFHPVHERGCW